ncbi:MAG: GatB/YqeY domain-containing protein [Clostridiaceae bacterium]
MTNIKELLMADLKEAMKNKDDATKSIISIIKGRIVLIEKENKGDIPEDLLISALSAELKQAKDSLNEFEKANREDLVEKIKRQIEYIEKFLPKQLSEEEIKGIINTTLIEENIEPLKQNKGKLMKVLMPKLKGKADGKLVQTITDDILK